MVYNEREDARDARTAMREMVEKGAGPVSEEDRREGEGASVPIGELRDLADQWEETYRTFRDSTDRERGMSEGARSAASELRQLIEAHEEGED